MSQELILNSNTTYFNQLIKAVSQTKKGDRIALITMSFNPTEPKIARLVKEMLLAAERNVRITFCYDAFALMFDGNDSIGGPLSPRGLRKKSLPYFEKMAHITKQLEDAGVTLRITNIPKRQFHIPYSGRSHIKGAVINSTWWIGGCNFDSSNNLDCMVNGSDKETADYLYDLFCRFADVERVEQAVGPNDIARKLSKNTQLLIDSGVKKQSLIYDEAIRLIDESKEWIIFTCQFFPSGKTAFHLAKAAKRGVHVRVLFNGNDKKVAGGLARRIYEHISHRKLPKFLFDDVLAEDLPYIHAKILATENGMIIGSHNMVSQGVRLGTAEIAIHSTDVSLIAGAAKMALKLAKKN